MQISQKGLTLLGKLEGIKLKPYLDSVNVPTIGIGSTAYCNGTKVTMKDSAITLDKAYETCACHINNIVIPTIQSVIKVQLNQNQIDALVCLIYNIGSAGFKTSHVARFINIGADEPTITQAWEMWARAGKDSHALLNRRKQEVALYFS